MKRRSFLKKAPIAGAAALGAASIRGSRLYGEPGSISTKTTVDNVVDAMLPSLFRLHTTIAGGSSAYTSARLATCRLALLLIKDEAFAQSFLNNPDDVMQRFGLSDLAVNKSNYEHNLVAALANSDVRKAAQAGDPVAFVNAMASANASPNYLPVPIINTWVVATAYIHMAAVATLSLVALAVVIAAVVVLVAGAVVAEDSPETLVANALGGEKFAQDVVAVQAKASISRVISSIESGEVTLPDGLSKDQAIDLLSNALQRHMICTN